MEALTDLVFGLDDSVVYALIALLVCMEAAAFVGLFVPGELSLLAGGALAATGRLSIVTLIVLCVLAAVAGDIIGYELGRRVGTRMLAWEPVRRRTHSRLPGITRYLAMRGGWVVIVGRWTSIMRAIVPALAGMTRMPYGRFLAANMIGAVTWVTAVAVAGFVAGASYQQIDSAWGRWSPLFAIAVLGPLFFSFRRWKAWSERETSRYAGSDDQPARRGSTPEVGASAGCGVSAGRGPASR